MQFTSSLVSLLLAAATTGVQALPGSPVEQRQDGAPRIYAKFWSDTACGADGGEWVEDTVWLQDPVGQCIDVNVWTIFGSTEMVTNSATHDLRAYNRDNCDESGNHYDVPAGETGCWAQYVDSVKFL